MARHVQWDSPIEDALVTPPATPKQHNKLKKPPPPAAIAAATEADQHPLVLVNPFPPTPDATPEKEETKKKGVLGIFKKGERITAPPLSTDVNDDVWTDTNTYFPKYQPVFPSLDMPPAAPMTRATRSNEYFPDYEPVYPDLFHPAKKYALQPSQAIMNAQMARLGIGAGVQWPDLPAFADFVGGQDKAKSGWQSVPWGTAGWTGYGWEGEKIPNAEGQVFSAPMPKGQAVSTEEGKKQQQSGGKNKKGGGGGGDGEDGVEKDATAEGDGEGKDEDGAGEGAGDGRGEGGGGEGTAEGGSGMGGGGGGGGGKKNKKKKK